MICTMFRLPMNNDSTAIVMADDMMNPIGTIASA